MLSSPDPDENMIFKSLRDAIIESYLSLLHGMTNHDEIDYAENNG